MQLPDIRPETVSIPEEYRSRSRRTSGTGVQLNALIMRRNSKLALPESEGLPEPGSRRSSSSIQFQETPPPRRPSIRQGGRPTMANIGRRISIMRRMSRITTRPEPPIEEKVVLPTNPRFVSSLSPEAQYAALKCYEDLLYERIIKASPEYSGMIQRTPSPPQNLQMLSIKDKPEEEDDKNSDRDDDGYGSDSDSEHKPVYIPLTAITGRSVSEIRPARLPELSREKRLMMTYRFECAFDILDTLKLREGHLVTSPRAQSAYADPIRNFAVWHNNWSKEFKIVKKIPASARV